MAPSGRREHSPRRLGILGGTFNPPHLGHLELARHALRELALDRVLLMPARLPPHKTATADPGAERRLEMCHLLLARTSPPEEEQTIAVSPLELQRDGPSYTADTLRALHATHPHASLTFILGADIARTLPTWHEPRELLAHAQLAVALRGASTRGDVLAALAPLLDPDTPEDCVRFLNMPAFDVSSSLVRERAQDGGSIAELVGPAVAAFVADNQLYRATHARTGAA